MRRSPVQPCAMTEFRAPSPKDDASPSTAEDANEQSSSRPAARRRSADPLARGLGDPLYRPASTYFPGDASVRTRVRSR